jgi:hypothetical protein
MVTILIILVSSGISLSSSRLLREGLEGEAKAVVNLIAKAHNNSMTGFQGDVWGIKVLNDDSDCPGSADCVVMFKGYMYDSRSSQYDQVVSLGIGTSTSAYIDADQENEFYFGYLSGWLSTTTGALAEQGILLNGYDGSQRVVTTTPTGVVYFDEP